MRQTLRVLIYGAWTLLNAPFLAALIIFFYSGTSTMNSEVQWYLACFTFWVSTPLLGIAFGATYIYKKDLGKQ